MYNEFGITFGHSMWNAYNTFLLHILYFYNVFYILL